MPRIPIVVCMRESAAPKPVRTGPSSRASYKRTGSSDRDYATSGTANTLTIAQDKWTAGEWAPGVVMIQIGKGAGQVRRITSNTKDTITVTNNWATNGIPDSTSVYEVINTSTWTLYNNVTGDNVSADGTTNITWNLE